MSYLLYLKIWGFYTELIICIISDPLIFKDLQIYGFFLYVLQVNWKSLIGYCLGEGLQSTGFNVVNPHKSDVHSVEHETKKL